MPFYDYQCLKCGEIEEIMASMSDDKNKVAPKCDCSGKNKKMKRIFSAPAIIINGRNITIGDMIDSGNVQRRPIEWFDEQSRNAKRNRKKYDFEK